MANGSKEIRVSLNIAIAATVTILATMASTAAWLFVWHASQRDALEYRLTLSLQDAVYTLNQRNDRQDVRRAQLFDIVIKRIDDYGARTTRMETMVLDQALEALVRERVEQDLPDALEEVLEDAP